jgi:hypothetical protein
VLAYVWRGSCQGFGDVCALLAGVSHQTETSCVLSKINDLLSKSSRSLEILVGDLGTHTDLSSRLDRCLNLLGQNAGEISLSCVRSEAHLQHNLGVCEVVVQDLGKLGEVPSVPLLHSHGVCVELLVEDVKTGDTLDDHGVDLVGRELELVSGERMRKTEAGRVHLSRDELGNERGHVLADGTVDILGRRVGDELERESRNLRNGVGELGISNGH